MTSIALIIGRVTVGCLGAILIYSALFLYKEEEGGLENRIEQWWKRIRELHAHAISRETAFLKIVAEVTSKGFAKLFGERLFGPKAVAASVCYSQAAVFLVATMTMMLTRFNAYLTARQAVELGMTFGTLSLFFLFLGSLGPFIHRQSPKLFWLSFVLIATASWPFPVTAVYGRILSSTGGKYQWPAIGYGIEFGAILLAVVCDFFFIALTRVMLARAAQSNSFITIVALAVGNACLAAVLFIGPFLFGLWVTPVANSSYGRLYTVLINVGEILIFFVGVSNFLDALVSLSWFMIAILMLLHRVLWPVIERPVYALFRHRVFSEQKKLVFFSGVALVGFALPRVGQALENIVKALHV